MRRAPSRRAERAPLDLAPLPLAVRVDVHGGDGRRGRRTTTGVVRARLQLAALRRAREGALGGGGVQTAQRLRAPEVQRLGELQTGPTRKLLRAHALRQPDLRAQAALRVGPAPAPPPCERRVRPGRSPRAWREGTRCRRRFFAAIRSFALCTDR